MKSNSHAISNKNVSEWTKNFLIEEMSLHRLIDTNIKCFYYLSFDITITHSCVYLDSFTTDIRQSSAGATPLAPTIQSYETNVGQQLGLYTLMISDLRTSYI